MMSEKQLITVGDRVKICWYSDGGISQIKEVEIINMPRGAGDLLQVVYDDGMIEVINPYHQTFVSMVKVDNKIPAAAPIRKD